MQQINSDYYYSTVQYNMYLSSFMNLKTSSIDKDVYESILGCLNHSIHKLYKLKGTLG
ncbi:hypothetical protein RaK2_00370 [Klebsiella phage vB_KleM_RaK2]|uniref:Uncharacterized protein n=1 Tax=Klebsiella phage vB_KleM_RaK2 TaxID=1147094 RepID=H6X4H7_9CAUD|nr:hypothetical protein F403_gp165 [Klebsiella phage vB_KleM_RaK2]AFA44643.1 hypothetical protein RaK2_00370 [Klebsiella phage vB_KleM_RaK2]